jgi:hypothetical protein
LRHTGCKVICHSEVFDSSGVSLRDVAASIARSDVMILLWSEAASRSDRVLFEYNMAIALREPIVLCLLDDVPLKPPLDKKRGIKVDQLSDLLGHILDSFPEAIKQPSESFLEKILQNIPDVSSSEEKQALESITKNLKRKGLVSPRLSAHLSEDVYMPDPDSKPNPLYKKILWGLGGLAGTAIVAAIGWLADPKNLSTAVEAGQNLMSIVSTVLHSSPPPTSAIWNQYVLDWKQELLHRQMQDGGFRVFANPTSSTQAWWFGSRGPRS